jgi:F-type H+-transporting ATPase subunit delta
MDKSRVRVRYSKALQASAKEMGLEQQIQSDMQQLLKIVNESPEFVHFLHNKSLMPSVKKKIFKNLFGEAFEELTLRFFNLIVDYQHEDMLKTIVYHYIETDRERMGILRAKLTTATPLSAVFKTQLQSRLEKSLNSKLDLDEHIDPSIIGGFILRVNDHQLNASVQAKLNEIKEKLITGR